MSTLAGSRVRLWAWLTLLALSACSFESSDGGCGGSLINNYRFDRWCGDELCNWTTLTGPESIQRAPTWHDNDYGVALLGTPTVLTQKRFIQGVECLEFEMVADIEPGADVELGLDYNFDGDPADPDDEAAVSLDVEVDDRFPLPTARWQKLTLLFPMPVAYYGVRFVIRKRGMGRAVLAEVRAQSSDKCTAARPQLETVPLGVACNDTSTCSTSTCTTTTPRQSLIDFCELATPEEDCAALWSGDDFGAGPGVCGECGGDADCPGQVCGVIDGKRGPYRGCVDVADNGTRCFDDAHCLSGHCAQLQAYNQTWLMIDSATCSECKNDSDCALGEVCGLDAALPARVCMAPPEKPLSSLCEVGAECLSGICCLGRCSECCNGGGDSCSEACVTRSFERDGEAFETPWVCPDQPEQPSGAECLENADCESGVCEGTEDVCTDEQRCIGLQCQEHASQACDVFITVAGVCQ
jgi:uncharacterized Fe-S cluster protein YjdI